MEWTSPKARPTPLDMQDPKPVRYLDRSTAPHVSTLILLAGISAMAMNVFLPSLPGMAAHF